LLNCEVVLIDNGDILSLSPLYIIVMKYNASCIMLEPKSGKPISNWDVAEYVRNDLKKRDIADRSLIFSCFSFEVQNAN
jgi:hypothetical protein